jgi:cytochrome oxidase Cu insertion factor (SCO1/SenC/PrrC family)
VSLHAKNGKVGAKGAARRSRRAALAAVIARFALLASPVLGGCAPLAAEPARAPARPAGATLPARDSLFSHPWTWTDERGQPVTFSQWRGQPLVVTAIFTQCKATCPRTMAKLLKVYDSFHKEGRAAQFLLVTLDPANDTPAVLARFKRSSGLPESWHFLTGSTEDTRDLRDLLGIHVIDDGPHLLHDGHIVVFDAQGQPTRSFAGWSLDDEATL